MPPLVKKPRTLSKLAEKIVQKRKAC